MEPETETEPKSNLAPGDGDEYSALHPWHESIVRSEKKGVDLVGTRSLLLYTEYKHQLTR